MSLRLRLLLGLLAVTAVGLAVFAFVSYGSLDSYLGARVDDQVRSAADPAAIALLSRPGNRACSRESAPSTAPSAPGAPGEADRGPLGGPPRPGSGPLGVGPDEPRTNVQLPPGTYAELRSPSGRVCDSVEFTYGQPDLAKPDLPEDIVAAPPGKDLRIVTVGSTGSGSTKFRATALQNMPGGSSIVVAVPTTESGATLNRLALIELVVALAVLVALGFLAWWVVRLGLRPLERMEKTAGEIAAGDLTRRVEPADPKTEVGRLGIALNSMLEQIEAAFAEREVSEARMRRFLSDASHELRTPLASIRGYSELFRIGATESPEGIEKAMGRIESESIRMGGLVDDLLTLARLDEVREPRRERVDLTRLLEEARDDAGVAAPGREITIAATDAVELSADPDQVRQVLANLVRNGLDHTPDGTPIELSLARKGTVAEISVRDHGAGLGDAVGPELFDRFWRASPDRGRASGGAGLGLAIVSAIVAAHGGEVGAADAPGGGAVFTVRLAVE